MRFSQFFLFRSIYLLIAFPRVHSVRRISITFESPLKKSGFFATSMKHNAHELRALPPVFSLQKKITTMASKLLLPLLLCSLQASYGADLVIRIPGDLSQQDGFYRLDYSPPIGFPAANTTFRPQAISDVIEFSRGLPGTKYDFRLYYSNSSIADWLTWTASITTAPDPPSNLSIDISDSKIALLKWQPPSSGGFSGFKLKVIPLSEPSKSIRNIVIREDSSPFQLRDLTPGATYEIQLFTVYENKESAAYISTNFTTKPNTPGRFIVWFRNETTLLVLWQPPYPAGVYTDYKVSIDPPDAELSETYVAKEGEPPGNHSIFVNGRFEKYLIFALN